MEYASVQAALEQRAKQQFGEDHTVVLDDRAVKDIANTKYFIRHSVVFGEGEPTSLGRGCYRYPGLQYMSIFFRPGEGVDTLLKLADEITKYYTHVTIDKAVFYVASLIRLPTDAKGFAQLQVVCPFYFDTRS